MSRKFFDDKSPDMHDLAGFTPTSRNTQTPSRTQCSGKASFVGSISREFPGQLDRVAPSDASILVIGETGTGKEVIARQIHERSGRSGPFVAVNCGALSESLGEAALFGHEAGAYTGANGARAGWFEAANGGTLFLDEIGDLPLTLQVALLRVLQERQVVRLGSRKPIALNVRVIAATNVDVSKAVANGQFRLDLYFRLSVVTLELPPLRARTADILPLASHFIALYSDRLQQRAPQLDPQAQQALLGHSWPGNIRELENVIHAAVLVCTDSVIRTRDLRLVAWPAAQLAAPAATAAVTHASSSTDTSNAATKQPHSIADIAVHLDRLFDSPHPQLLADLESLVIHQAMEYCHGNQVHTAKLLGISRNVLRTYLKRFGLIAESGLARSGLRVVEVPKSMRGVNRPAHRYSVRYQESLRASGAA